jgi:polyisoprenoid-binding protein YceI
VHFRGGGNQFRRGTFLRRIVQALIVTLIPKDPWGNTRVGLEASTKINRKDFGLTWNTALETGGVLVGEDVTITLDVEFIKA